MRFRTATSRPGSASSRPQSATSRGSNATPRSEFVVQNVSKQEQKSSSRPESARLSEVEAEKISESEYVSVRFNHICLFVVVSDARCFRRISKVTMHRGIPLEEDDF